MQIQGKSEKLVGNDRIYTELMKIHWKRAESERRSMTNSAKLQERIKWKADLSKASSGARNKREIAKEKHAGLMIIERKLRNSNKITMKQANAIRIYLRKHKVVPIPLGPRTVLWE